MPLTTSSTFNSCKYRGLWRISPASFLNPWLIHMRISSSSLPPQSVPCSLFLHLSLFRFHLILSNGSVQPSHFSFFSSQPGIGRWAGRTGQRQDTSQEDMWSWNPNKLSTYTTRFDTSHGNILYGTHFLNCFKCRHYFFDIASALFDL